MTRPKLCFVRFTKSFFYIPNETTASTSFMKLKDLPRSHLGKSMIFSLTSPDHLEWHMACAYIELCEFQGPQSALQYV